MQSIPSGAFEHAYENQLRKTAVQRATEKLKNAGVQVFENPDGLFIKVPSGAQAWQIGRNQDNGFLVYQIKPGAQMREVDFELPENLRLELVEESV